MAIHVLSSSSMNRQFPSERWTMRSTNVAGRASPTNARIRASAASPCSGARSWIDHESGPTTLSRSEGRAVANTSRPPLRGCSWAASRKASRSGPAQWRSSMSHATGPSSALSSAVTHASKAAARSLDEAGTSSWGARPGCHSPAAMSELTSPMTAVARASLTPAAASRVGSDSPGAWRRRRCA